MDKVKSKNLKTESIVKIIEDCKRKIEFLDDKLEMSKKNNSKDVTDTHKIVFAFRENLNDICNRFTLINESLKSKMLSSPEIREVNNSLNSALEEYDALKKILLEAINNDFYEEHSNTMNISGNKSVGKSR